jgi:hypothetical protein
MIASLAVAGLIHVQAPSPAVINKDTTAATLAKDCASSDLGGGLCLTYLTNGADAMRDPSNSALKGAACLPAKATFEDFRRAYLGFVRRKPSVANDPAVVVMLQAYSAAYPCR